MKFGSTKLSIFAFLCSICSMICCGPYRGPLIEDEPQADMSLKNNPPSQTTPTPPDLGGVYNVDMTIPPQANCVDSSPAKEFGACCNVLCNGNVASIQSGIFKKQNRIDSELFCQFSTDPVEFNCVNYGLRCDQSKGGCVR
jgi:hypothetical protein